MELTEAGCKSLKCENAPFGYDGVPAIVVKGILGRATAETPSYRTGIPHFRDGLTFEGLSKCSAMRYKAMLRKTDAGYSVWRPGLPVCWSQGETEEEALQNIREAIAEYLKVAERLREKRSQ